MFEFLRGPRVFVALLCGILAGGYMLWESLTKPISDRSSLRQIEGVVDGISADNRNNILMNLSFPGIMFLRPSNSYHYWSWLPDPDRIQRNVRVGDKVRLLSDTPDGRNLIWHLEKGADVIVAYDEVLSAVQSHHRIKPYLAGSLIMFGIGGFYARSKLKPLAEEDTTADSKS